VSSDGSQHAVREADQKQATVRRTPAGHGPDTELLDVPGQVAQANHAIGLVHDGGGRIARHLSGRNVAVLQRIVGNQAVAGLLRSSLRSAAPSIIQRAVFKDGGKGAVAISTAAKTVAKYVNSKSSVQPGGSRHIADIQGRGFPGFKMFKDEYAGGRVFNNNPMPDGNRLPYSNGETYQEWDSEPCVAGAARGADRVVTSSTGKVYYSNDHYANFTEFTP